MPRKPFRGAKVAFIFTSRAGYCYQTGTPERGDAGTPNALKFAPGNPFSDAAPYDGKCSRNR